MLLPIPFTDLTSQNVRPAVVIGRNAADLFLAPFSSVLFNTDFLLNEWREAGLNVPCGVKAQLATVEENFVVKIVGTLAATVSKMAETLILPFPSKVILRSPIGSLSSSDTANVQSVDVRTVLGENPRIH